MKNLIFGASGFIGQHLKEYLDSEAQYFDVNTKDGKSEFCDVRKPLVIDCGEASVIYNLAALCTIPKYEEKEYYETNILGAENVCNFARENNINTIVFTSSIAPYGMREEEKTEDSLPMPTNPYGISKLVAEHIHRIWQAERPDERSLIILRPGIVFGKGEGGNFSRLYSAISKGLFFYPGRKDSKKACVYVKDLVSIMIEMSINTKPGVALYNCCYPHPHSIEEICKVIAKETNFKEPRLTIPAGILKIVASSINIFGKAIGKSFYGIHPDRVKKLMISTNINGQKLLDHGYKMEFSLEEAITDWFDDCNQTGLY